MRDIVGQKRIVQKTGTSTLIVSLPRTWTERTGVKKGSELFALEQPDGSMVLSTRPDEEKRESFDLSLDDVPSKDELSRKFYSAYIAGFDSIRVHSSSRITPELRKTVLQETKRLIGLEIVDETPNVIVVKDFFSREGLSVEKTLKRMHLITCSLFEDLLEGKELDAVVERDDEVDRLRFLLLRQLNLALKNPQVLRGLNLTANRCIDYATATLYIERIADHVTAMAKILSREKTDVFKPFRQPFEKVYSLYKDSVKAFLEKDFALSMKTIKSKPSLHSEMGELNKRLWQKGMGYSPLVEHSNSILDGSEGIAEQAINQS